MHEPYLRQGSGQAVVFIHGIVGTPRFWDFCISAVPEGWTVANLLLPGHGGSVRDFGSVRWGAWEDHVRRTLAELRRTHQRIYLAGHSMGALLAILAAEENPEGIAGLLLMAPPLRIRPRLSALVRNTLKGVGLLESKEELAKYYGTEQDWRVWRYIGWIPRYLELFALSRRSRQALPLSLPLRVFMHGHDELVSPRGAKLLDACPDARVQTLADSAHHDVAAADAQTVRNALAQLLTQTL